MLSFRFAQIKMLYNKFINLLGAAIIIYVFNRTNKWVHKSVVTALENIFVVITAYFNKINHVEILNVV